MKTLTHFFSFFSQEDNLRSSAFETINRVVENHRESCRPVVLELSTWVFAKLQATFTASALTEEDRDNNAQLQSLLVAALHYVVLSCDEAEVVSQVVGVEGGVCVLERVCVLRVWVFKSFERGRWLVI